jgi:hypothetical protein
MDAVGTSSQGQGTSPHDVWHECGSFQDLGPPTQYIADWTSFFTFAVQGRKAKSKDLGAPMGSREEMITEHAPPKLAVYLKPPVQMLLPVP